MGNRNVVSLMHETTNLKNKCFAYVSCKLYTHSPSHQEASPSTISRFELCALSPTWPPSILKAYTVKCLQCNSQ